MAGMFDNFQETVNKKSDNCQVHEMFDDFHETSNNQPFCPIHTDKEPPKNVIVGKPYEQYNVLGELIGYWWHEGDKIVLDFDIDGEVIIDHLDENGNVTPLYVEAKEFVKDKFITFKMYNFRGSVVAKKTYPGDTNIKFDIDDKLSEELKKGVYTCSLEISDSKSLGLTIYTVEQCTFTIK